MSWLNLSTLCAPRALRAIYARPTDLAVVLDAPCLVIQLDAPAIVLLHQQGIDQCS